MSFTLILAIIGGFIESQKPLTGVIKCKLVESFL
jgi:hypothetical protein